MRFYDVPSQAGHKGLIIAVGKQTCMVLFFSHLLISSFVFAAGWLTGMFVMDNNEK